MKLTEKTNIKKFTRQHYVEHYDLQTELVDHLANDIEKICEEQPNLSFEQAKTISFKKFGVFGFMDVNLILSNVEALIYATLFTFLIMLFYIVLEILPKKAGELLSENYLEYKLV